MHTRLELQASKDLLHFVELARQGNHAAASGGEQRAFRLAQAILADAWGLDDSAIKGLGWFARLASASHAEASRLVSIGNFKEGEPDDESAR